MSGDDFYSLAIIVQSKDVTFDGIICSFLDQKLTLHVYSTKYCMNEDNVSRDDSSLRQRPFSCLIADVFHVC